MTASRSLADKLERVERTITIYDKASKDLYKEIDIVVTIDELIKIFTIKEDDPFFYDGYLLSESQLDSLNAFVVEEKIKPDFNKYYYVLQAHGIYNWDPVD